MRLRGGCRRDREERRLALWCANEQERQTFSPTRDPALFFLLYSDVFVIRFWRAVRANSPREVVRHHSPAHFHSRFDCGTPRKEKIERPYYVIRTGVRCPPGRPTKPGRWRALLKAVIRGEKDLDFGVRHGGQHSRISTQACPPRPPARWTCRSRNASASRPGSMGRQR